MISRTNPPEMDRFVPALFLIFLYLPVVCSKSCGDPWIVKPGAERLGETFSASIFNRGAEIVDRDFFAAKQLNRLGDPQTDVGFAARVFQRDKKQRGFGVGDAALLGRVGR